MHFVKPLKATKAFVAFHAALQSNTQPVSFVYFNLSLIVAAVSLRHVTQMMQNISLERFLFDDYHQLTVLIGSHASNDST